MFKRKNKRRGHVPEYRRGDNLLICDRSGFVIRRSEAKKTWDGLWVHKDFWEPRHPQDFVRGKQEKIKADVVRPEASPALTIDGSPILTGADRYMTGSNNWSTRDLAVLNVNDTVSGKMYMLGNGGQDQ
jgi:hypothetical protein